jgi:RNA polymerase sigma-70 factor (ECF subfamily)
MTARPEPATEQLLDAAARGDGPARNRLIERYRRRLKRMVAVRLDRRLSARVDPSDVVQDTLADAARKLDGYLRDRPLPFYPWLRQLAADRLGRVYREHVRAGRRSVKREAPARLPAESAWALAERLLDSGKGPSAALRRDELRNRVRAALDRLPERDREVLVLRHLEQLSTSETAEVIGASEGAVKMRLLRAAQRLHQLLHEEGQP